jgi:hypothetical protein
MPKKKAKRKTTKPKTSQTPIPASKLLRAEATRLDVLSHAMPDKAQGVIKAEVWAFEMAAAFLDSLGAPERLQRYVPTTEVSEPANGETL